MPELPEVETVCRGLQKTIIGKIIDKTYLSDKKMREPVQADFSEKILGLKVLNISRRSKYILIELSKNYILVIHLGMSGKILFKKLDYQPQKHDHLTLIFDDKNKLVFNDPRRFGLYTLVRAENLNQNKLFKNLCIEPLTKEFNGEYLQKIFVNKTINIKQAIMNAKNLVGVGNIYASESLFRSKINPTTPANKVTIKQLQILAKNIKNVLEQAITSGGSTLRDFVRSDGGAGYFQNKHFVYGRENLPCNICGTNIKRIVQQGRSSFYCEKCQH
jgi:formamidopyrimidine-DNA glycosylase